MVRPSSVSEGDVVALVAYVDRSIDLWSQGVVTHQQAGRTDFIAQGQILSSLAQLELAMQKLAIEGEAQFDFTTALTGFNQLIIEQLADPDSEPTAFARTFFVLKDEKVVLSSAVL